LPNGQRSLAGSLFTDMEALHDTHLFLGALVAFLLLVLGFLFLKEALFHRENERLKRQERMLQQALDDIQQG
jgi:Flp pilus assembly protein TadB